LVSLTNFACKDSSTGSSGDTSGNRGNGYYSYRIY
jgi:hypothetical protein